MTSKNDVVRAVDDLVVASGADHGGYDGVVAHFTFTIDAGSLQAATALALERLPALPEGWEMVAVHVERYDTLAMGTGYPELPEMVGLEEAADILDISRQRARALVRSADFPPPVFEFESGPVYLASDIHRFAAKPRHPGRPLDDPEFRPPVHPDLGWR